MNETQESPNVSVEQNGRVLTGGPGTSVEALEQAVEREPAPVADRFVVGEGAPARVQQGSQPEAKQTRGQARFSELTKEREVAKQAAKEANDRAVALESRLKAIEERTAPAGKPESPPAASAPVSVSSGTRPKPSEDEIGTTYKTYGDYVEDLTDWKSEQRDRKAADERAQSSRVEKWTAERANATALYPDFDTVLKTGPGADVDLSPDPATAVARVQMLMEIPGGAHVVYKLAKDAAEATRLAALDDRAFGFAVARLLPPESNGAQPASPQTQRATKAPPPYQPVQAGGKTTATTAAEIAAKGGNYDEYRAKRAAERGVKPRYR
jgi:hypothetical protein